MTREEAIMANYSQKAKKIKTPFAKMIVEGNQEKPYFSILYFDPIDKDFYVGYSSYCLDYVSNWLNEEFEIVEDENFIIAALRPVSREQVILCKDCQYWQGNNGGYPHPECRWGNDETPDEDDYCSFAERLEVSKNG